MVFGILRLSMPPYRDDPQRVTYFAETDSRGKKTRFGIKAQDRSRHMYVIGKTGMGKSTLLENLAIQDIQNGEGLAFIDPHGSTAEKLLDYVPQERIKDVLYFAPFDMDFPVAFNVMEDVGYDKRHLVVSGLMSAFKKIWVDAWSARMEYILSNTLLALLEYPNSTLLDVNKMLVSKTFRKKVVDYITDPLVKSFWAEEFAGYSDRYTQDATPAIQNKIGQFTSNPLIRNVVGQAKSTFDIRQMMDDRKILIINLSKGRIGETNADLLGSMITTKIYLAAMSRADLSEQAMSKLPNFYFYVDEFQSIANDSFADILSEARKYKLALTIAHQYIEQMEENVRHAVFGNVGTTITFRVGPFDAEVLETVFDPYFLAADLVNLGRFQMYLTLMIDQVGSRPFSATGLPRIAEPRLSYRDHIIANSRKMFARSRAEVERDIADHGKPEDPPEAPSNSKVSAERKEVRERPRAERSESAAEARPRVDRERKPRSDERPVRREITQEKSSSLKELIATKAARVETTQTKGADPRTVNAQKDPTPEHREQLRNVLATIVKAEESAQKTVSPVKETAQAKRPERGALPNQTPKTIDEVTPEKLRKLLEVDGK